MNRLVTTTSTEHRPRTMVCVHLTASRFFGAPERQMLGLAEELRDDCETVFVSFSEGGCCRAFLQQVQDAGFRGIAIARDTPNLPGALLELSLLLRRVKADVVIGHSYKANILGLLAARRNGIPMIAVSHGWTAESFRVKAYEKCERVALRYANRIVCVSHGQAVKVARAGVERDKIDVIWDAVDACRFQNRDRLYGDRLTSLFSWRPRLIVGAAGRLSPEKGFDLFVEAARMVIGEHPDVGFVLFGEGKLRERLSAQVAAANLGQRFVMPGFFSDLDRYLPWLDMLVLSSHTEGLPNIVLEACVASVPVVATSVGGTPEIISEGLTGRLVPSNNAAALAKAIADLVDDSETRVALAERARENTLDKFTFAAQAEQYRRLFRRVCQTPADAGPCEVSTGAR